MTPVATQGEAGFAAALLEPALPCPKELVAWNGSDATRRLAVHRNNVVGSLVDALAQTFPVVQELVGTEFFGAMAAVFVRQVPPRSRILAHFGSAFPDFIDAFGPAQSVPYLSDMARLEMTRVRAYHAADVEPVASGPIGLALASGERLGELRMLCHSSVHVIRSPYAVVSLWAAHQQAGDLGAIDPYQGESALVLRDGLDVLVLRISLGTADFVTAIQQGHCLGDAANAALGAAPDFDLAATLALLLGHGALTSLELPRRLSS